MSVRDHANRYPQQAILVFELGGNGAARYVSDISTVAIGNTVDEHYGSA